jgi:RNA polymerase sigma-70 factor (ECF subfamily)
MQSNQAAARAERIIGIIPERAWPVTEQGSEFSRVYEEYHGKVRAYAARLLGPEEADDLAQEVFLRISRSLGTLAEPSKLASWVYAITLNAARDAVRRRASRPPLSSPAAKNENVPLFQIADLRTRTPEESATRNEMVACYLDFVKRLRPRDREVYVLSELGDLANEEIARRLSLPLGTVKMRLHRARARLYEELRRNCRCYTNARGELMGEPKTTP